MQSTDHQLEVVVHGQVGRGGKGAVDEEEEGSLGFVRMQQIVVECYPNPIHTNPIHIGFLLLAAHKITLSCTKHICDQVA